MMSLFVGPRRSEQIAGIVGTLAFACGRSAQKKRKTSPQ